MSTRFLVTNPFDDETIWLFDTKDEATAFALRQNRNDHNHPSIKLFQMSGRKARYVGRLWREFGHDFDPAKCWNHNPSVLDR